MARKPRLYIPGCSHHVIQRGNNREACFYDESDYKVYLDILKESSFKHNVAVHAFVLMTNHVHLLVNPSCENGVSKMMQSIGRSYVGYFNYTYGRSGTLWEGRYKSTLVDSEKYMLTVSRYIELNPVRAAMVSHASEYPWSSYHGNALGKEIELLKQYQAYLQLGTTKQERICAYCELFKGHMSQKTIDEINESTIKGWVLGDARFKEQIELYTGVSAKPRQRGGDRKSARFKDQLGSAVY